MRSRILIGLFSLVVALASGGAAFAAPTSGAVEWQIGSGTYLAGRDYTVSRKIDGSLTATGETIEVTGDSHVKGDVWIAARRVAVEGHVGGNLDIRAQDAIINGEVKGNVSFYGMHISFGPDARIDGNVDYFAALPAEMDSGAKIKGNLKSSVLRDIPMEPKRDDAPPALKPLPHGAPSIDGYGSYYSDEYGWSAPGYHLSWSGAVFFGIVAGLISAFWPTAGASLAAGLSDQPFAALSFGFLWLVGTPVLAVVAAFTIIGLPLAFIVLLMWPLAVLAGIVAIIMGLGGKIESRFTFVDEGLARRLAGIILATVIIRIGISLPGFGPLIWLVAVSFGIGALVFAGRTRWAI